jgi:arsenate reductase
MTGAASAAICAFDHSVPAARSLCGVDAQIYVNPSCSKCRSALSLLDEHHMEAESVHYLDAPPTRADLERLMDLLGIEDPRLMMRTNEPVYAELALDQRARGELLDAITRHPILLERPIFVVGNRAVIARPPERVLELL